MDAQGRGVFQAAKESWLMVVASHPNLSGADCAVAIAISKHLNSKSRQAWPSLDTLAALTNRDKSTVWRSIEKLEAHQLLHVARARGRTKSNRYRPLMGEVDRDPKTLRRRTKKTVNSKHKDCELAVRTLEEV
jgi:predicted transcriptional regulator